MNSITGILRSEPNRNLDLGLTEPREKITTIESFFSSGTDGGGRPAQWPNLQGGQIWRFFYLGIVLKNSDVARMSGLHLGSFSQTHLFTLLTGLPDGLFSDQKSQIWVNFGRHLNGKKCWYTL
jgi:hypothetical protein